MIPLSAESAMHAIKTAGNLCDHPYTNFDNSTPFTQLRTRTAEAQALGSALREIFSRVTPSAMYTNKLCWHERTTDSIMTCARIAVCKHLQSAGLIIGVMPAGDAVPLISYHYPCPDGVFAALAAYLSFSSTAQKVVWVPNAVYAPKQLDDLQLQVNPFTKPNKQ